MSTSPPTNKASTQILHGPQGRYRRFLLIRTESGYWGEIVPSDLHWLSIRSSLRTLRIYSPHITSCRKLLPFRVERGWGGLNKLNRARKKCMPEMRANFVKKKKKERKLQVTS